MTVVVLTSGSSWTRPDDCPDILDLVECWGGGGPGRDASGKCGGGGGGAYASKSDYSIGSQTSITIQIPGQTASGLPSDTYFDNASTGVMAKSGENATSTAGYGGAGGSDSLSVGTTKHSGGNGGAGGIYSGGGGGGAASPSGAGSNGSPQGGANAGGAGGNAGTGGASGGTAPGQNSPGVVGGSSEEGGGGASGASYYTTSANGHGGSPGGGGGGTDYGYGTMGYGARGQIRITYTSVANTVFMMCEA